LTKFIKSIFLVFSFLFLIFPSAQADTMVLDFTHLWIDHNDTLIIDGNNNTLQWYYHGNFSPVGLWNRNLTTQEPAHVKITNNGLVVMDTDWKIWTVMPSGPTYSSTLSIPSIPSVYDSLSETHTGRNSITFKEASYPKMEVMFYDSAIGADWYTSKITIDYTPVPIPPSLLLLGSGLIGFAGLRRKLQK
jgi:hypothetical protein